MKIPVFVKDLWWHFIILVYSFIKFIKQIVVYHNLYLVLCNDHRLKTKIYDCKANLTTGPETLPFISLVFNTSKSVRKISFLYVTNET
jgi:hypothetical protein